MKCRSSILLLHVLIATVASSGCAASRLSVGSTRDAGRHVVTVGVAPGGSQLADMLGVELLKGGFKIVDSAAVGTLLAGMKLTDSPSQELLDQFKKSGIDAVLMVDTVLGMYHRPQSASIRVVHVDTGAVIVGLSWQNGWKAPFPGLEIPRKGMSEAAQEIGKELLKNLRPE